MVGKVTANHDEIRSWVEARGGKPAEERQEGTGAAELRIAYPGAVKPGLSELSWDEWFERLDEQKLAFVCDEPPMAGLATGLIAVGAQGGLCEACGAKLAETTARPRRPTARATGMRRAEAARPSARPSASGQRATRKAPSRKGGGMKAATTKRSMKRTAVTKGTAVGVRNKPATKRSTTTSTTKKRPATRRPSRPR